MATVNWRSGVFRNDYWARKCLDALKQVVPGLDYRINATVLDGEFDRDPAIFVSGPVSKQQKALLDAVLIGWGSGSKE
jgi:hypothetical protein